MSRQTRWKRFACDRPAPRRTFRRPPNAAISALDFRRKSVECDSSSSKARLISSGSATCTRRAARPDQERPRPLLVHMVVVSWLTAAGRGEAGYECSMGQPGAARSRSLRISHAGRVSKTRQLLASFDAFRLFGQAARRPRAGRVRSRRSRRNGVRFGPSARGAGEEQGSAAAGVPGNRGAEDGWSASILRHAERRVSVAGDLLEPDLSARRRGCDPSAKRAELFRRSDGRDRRAAAGAARQQPCSTARSACATSTSPPGRCRRETGLLRPTRTRSTRRSPRCRSRS